MKYSFRILTAALAVGFFTLPAYAAVSDVEGGEIHVNTQINKHYTEVDGGTIRELCFIGWNEINSLDKTFKKSHSYGLL